METVGDYEYDSHDLIGHGAFAVVFKGRYRKDPSKMVAIKSISKKSLSKSHNLLGKEIKILKELTELNHENVVALFYCKETPHNVYLVMEYCNGGDLADYLNAKGTLSEDTIRLFLIQLAGAMKALYGKGVVHRDLKPQNILLSHSGVKPYPQPSEIKLKIADFGFARFLQDGVMAATLCGSPMYMAPEVIMSLQYDAKADLWSLGTIIYQCLTGKAPFHAASPHALKTIYERNANLAPKIPAGTSPELHELLMGLLKRNASERMNFEQFFNHKFLKRPEFLQSNTSLAAVDLPLPTIYGSPPTLTARMPIGSPPTLNNRVPAVVPVRASTPIKVGTPPKSQPESPQSTHAALSSSPEDDFVLVPSNIPLDHSIESIGERQQFKMPIPPSASPQPCAPAASPPRPSFLPISEPKPVPSQRVAFEKMTSQQRKNEKNEEPVLPSPPKSVTSSVPRSEPITMKRSEHRQADIDISSLSPPSVQFVIGTPPGGGRRRSAANSLCETPPSIWQVSPVAVTPPPPLSGPLARVPILSNPNLSENNNLQKSPIMPFGSTRARTLPEISELGNYQPLFSDNFTSMDYPLPFEAPELPEETLLEREHNEALAKINFALALSNCILDLVTARAAPLPALVDDAATKTQPQTEIGRKAEQLVLLVKVLQLLSSGLAYGTQQLQTGNLRLSSTVRQVMLLLNSKFRSTGIECRKLLSSGIINKAGSTSITAEKILYNHAMQMCQSAAVDELFGNPAECCQRYQTAQILLHSLAQQVQDQRDKELLTRYKEKVEKRLSVLQEQGYVYATDIELNV